MALEPSRGRRSFFIALGLILAVGIFLRIPAPVFSGKNATFSQLEALHPAPKFDAIGFDEGLYRSYVNGLIAGGLTGYPDIVDRYIEVQKKLTGSILPPVRFLYIFAAYLWHQVFGSETLAALRNVASFFSILTLLLSTVFAWRLKGPAWALGVAALMSFAPTQIHMSQHALVDGFFTFWALLCLWLLWENLQAPGNWRLVIAYAIALMLLVLTKENSFFVWIALVALLLANHWLGFGTITREVVVAMIVGPLFGVVLLIFLAGGIDTLFQCYQLSVGRNFTLRYAIL